MYQEALQNTPEFVFKEFATRSTSEIHEYIEPFFSTAEHGIHILIVCLPDDAPLPDNDIIQQALSHENDPCLPLPTHGETTPLDCTKRFFVVSPRLNDYEAVLRKVSEYAEICYNKPNLFLHLIHYTPKTSIMNNVVASQLQSELQDALDSANVKHTLFAILLLPESFFEEVKTMGTSLPCFFEYIVLGVGVQGAMKELKEQLNEKDEENEKLKEENKKLKEENKMLKAKNELLYEKTTEKERERDNYIVVLTTYLLALLREGVLTEDMNNKLKETLDQMKKRDDLPAEMKTLIAAIESYLYQNIKTKTY